MSPASKLILDAEGIEKSLFRIANEILERNDKNSPLLIVGVRTRGVYLAERLRSQIKKISGIELPLGVLDITLYRDDLSEIGPRASVRETQIDVSLQDHLVILVDDVLFTGRTIRAALDAIHDLGRPRAIQLAVLIDRGHRELPIKADYVGKNIPTSMQEEVIVHLKESDELDEAIVRPRGNHG